jgi:hypothetical protein
MFLFICLALLVVFISLFKKAGLDNPFSKGLALGTALSFLVTISLAQNYTQSLIPEANDGIGISNKIAYWIIGEDGWSHGLFENVFNYSMYTSLFMLLIYPIVLLLETRITRKH